MKWHGNNKIRQREVASENNFNQNFSQGRRKISNEGVFIGVNYFGNIAFLIFGGNNQGVEIKRFSFGIIFAIITKIALFRDKFFASGTNLKI